MPNIIHPKNAEAWREERRARQKLHPEFADLRNSTANAKEGEHVKVIVRVKDIADGNPVTLLLFRRGQDPAVHIPLVQRTAVVKDGVAQFTWSYNHPRDMDFPADDPGFFPVVYSAWCPPIRGEVVEIELVRPEVTVIDWEAATYDGDGNETGSEKSGEVEYLKKAMVSLETKDVKNGEFVNVSITNESTGSVLTQAVEIKGGKGRLPCDISPTRETLAAIKKGDGLRYRCDATPAKRGKTTKGPSIEVTFKFAHTVSHSGEAEDFGGKYVLESDDGSYKQDIKAKGGATIEDNSLRLEYTGIKPGLAYSLYHLSDKGSKSFQFEKTPFAAMIHI